jgi:hypothetical protein
VAVIALFHDVILFDPADREYPLAFNMLDCANKEQQSLVVSGLMSVFKKLWPDAFSGRMEYILRNALLALTEAENNSMLGITRMFSDDAFRAKVLEKVHDHLVLSFWQDEYMSWSDKYRTEAIAAIQNKIGQLLSVPLIRNIVGQVTSTLDVRHAMDTGKIILVNLSKGKLGEDERTEINDSFDAPVEVTINYTNEDVVGIDISTLTIYHYEDGSGWRALSNCSVNQSDKTVTCETTSFSIFGLFGSEQSSGGEVTSSGSYPKEIINNVNKIEIKTEITSVAADPVVTQIETNLENNFQKNLRFAQILDRTSPDSPE